jgi:hypothetical protein
MLNLLLLEMPNYTSRVKSGKTFTSIWQPKIEAKIEAKIEGCSHLYKMMWNMRSEPKL